MIRFVSKMTSSPIKWDGSNIGSIDNRITNFLLEDSQWVVELDKTHMCYLSKYVGSVCIIADELKYIFGADKIGRCLCVYRGDVLMLQRKLNDVPFLTSQVCYTRDAVKRAFVVRWILGLTMTIEKSLVVRTYKSGIIRVIPSLEKKYDFLKDNHYGSQLPETVMSKWFDDDFDDIVRSIIHKYTFQELREKIRKVVVRIDTEHSIWIVSICERLGSYIKEIE
jgi:hypothetical protein